jgi:hypothetical protein
MSHGAHDISQCNMTTQLTSFNNYLSNKIITSSYTPSYKHMPPLSQNRLLLQRKVHLDLEFYWLYLHVMGGRFNS